MDDRMLPARSVRMTHDVEVARGERGEETDRPLKLREIKC